MYSGSRPFSSCKSICLPVTSSITADDSVCNTVAVAVTSTVSVAEPTASTASSESAVFGSSLLWVLVNFLNPAASTETV